ncbi:MAG: divergent polysaccharide deacetylase family protein [Nitrospirae bacterium]|nr:divergent polysaccharide deacetylase family protein [Nitrospirota bacterium]
MNRRRRSKIVIWILLLALITLALISLWIQWRQSPQSEIVPDIGNREIARPERQIERPMPEMPEPPVYKVKVAILIDDIGYDNKIFKKFVDFGIPLTFSILPDQRFSTRIAKEARSLNYEVMLHLPMEPRNPERNPGNGTLVTRMSQDEILKQLSEDIEAVPYIAGVNNHMGSLLTENRDVMNIILEEIHKRGLFFVDSKTSPRSVAYETAKRIGIRSGRRDVFLDNKSDIEYIKGQVDKVIRIARQNGEATAIGHPRAGTIAALREKIADFKREGIELVPVSEVLD